MLISQKIFHEHIELTNSKIPHEHLQEKVQESRSSLVLKMMTRLFECLQPDELNPVVDELAPCAIKASLICVKVL